MKFRTILLGLTALFVAFNAAFFSVTGLSKLFAGATNSVILMASSLELAKLISAGFLYNYWDKLSKVLRVYLTIAVGILILITSAGIYGFLTSAYQTTADQLGIMDKQTQVVQMKKNRFEEQLKSYNEEKNQLTQTISSLSSGLSNNIQTSKDRNGNIISSSSSANRNVLNSQLSDAKTQRTKVEEKIEILTDSITKLDVQIIEVQTGNSVAAEVGPLKFMAETTGSSMNSIVNWFALFIVLVFDPLAVTLVIAFNSAVKIDKGEEDKKKVVQKRELYGEEPDEKETQKEALIEMMQNDEELGLYDEWGVVIDDEPTTEISTDTNLDLDGDGIISDDERNADTDGDGVISDEELKRWYDAGGWKSPYDGKPYFYHPLFDWSKRERWINDRKAIEYWLNYQGGSHKALEEYKKESDTE
jgi:hypothetical protein